MMTAPVVFARKHDTAEIPEARSENRNDIPFAWLATAPAKSFYPAQPTVLLWRHDGDI